MLKVGLVGEDPHDTLSIKLLLLKSYNNVRFYQLGKGIKGYQLDNPKTKRTIIVEKEDHKCNFIIYIRDLDGYCSEKTKVENKKKWFNELNKVTGNNNVLLLNIWELEALILADIETFNKHYHVESTFKSDPQLVKDPKEVLKHLTRKNKKNIKSLIALIFFQNLIFLISKTIVVISRTLFLNSRKKLILNELSFSRL